MERDASGSRPTRDSDRQHVIGRASRIALVQRIRQRQWLNATATDPHPTSPHELKSCSRMSSPDAASDLPPPATRQPKLGVDVAPRRKSHQTKDPLGEVPSPSVKRYDDQQDDGDPFFTKLVLAPLHFVSFLVSLAWIERSSRSYRASERSSPSSNWSPRNWLSPEPYQSSNKDVSSSEGEGKQSWFLRRKHRKMLKFHVGRALELRAPVMAVLATLILISAMALGWGLNILLARLLSRT
ncbi:hypothetical protein EJ06DRAFT_30117 [Trichodelitschia bisporula]|uniref:Uncharacterized protein n=1 Tax=Trichodelitschia bisporula TaxID=703511 RepID=A0A6G1IBR4_9PEZI|nr:hypothetical protein EJ06DRAFT_30117 [Trichodelitschia bisporula]